MHPLLVKKIVCSRCGRLSVPRKDGTGPRAHRCQHGERCVAAASERVDDMQLLPPHCQICKMYRRSNVPNS